jgi:hypothetical protein
MAANLVAVVEAASTAEAAVVVATAETKAAKLEAATRASAAEAATKSLHETEKSKTIQPTNDISKAMQTGTGPSTRAAARAAGAGVSTFAQGNPTPPSNTTNPRVPAQEEDQQQDIVDWDLTDALPKGLNLSDNKTLMEDYPEDETNSKKPQKTDTGKGKKGSP